jgi:hypothetical protein
MSLGRRIDEDLNAQERRVILFAEIMLEIEARPHECLRQQKKPDRRLAGPA